MAKGSSGRAFGWIDDRQPKLADVTRHLQDLESENRALRKELHAVSCYTPQLLNVWKKRRMRSPSSPTSSLAASRRASPARSHRPSTSIGMRQSTGAVSIYEEAGHAQPKAASRGRPSTSTGFRPHEEDVLMSSPVAHTRSRRRSPRRSPTIRVPGHEATPGVSSQDSLYGAAESPGTAARREQQRRSKAHQNAFQTPMRPSTSLGIRGDQNEPRSPQSWQGYRRARRPNTSIGTRGDGAVSPESSDRQFPSDRLMHPQPAIRLKDQRPESTPPPSRWKSKAFNKDEWDRFLARNSEHNYALTRRSLDMEQLTRMHVAPLGQLPISSMVFRIDGGLYAVSDARVKAKKPLSNSSLDLSAVSDKDPASPKKKSPSNADRQSASWRDFLDRQTQLLQRQSARCKSPDALEQGGERGRGSASPKKGDGDKFEEFFKRNLDYRAAKEEYLEGLRNFYCPPRAESPPVQDPAFMVRHDPKKAHEHFQEAVDEANQKWKIDHPLEPGQSALFKKKSVTQQESDEFWQKNKDFPHVSNREPPTAKEPPETGFRTSGNPYEGGKADALLNKLGPKSGITPLNATLP